MLADQLEASALLKTGDEGSMDQTGNVEQGMDRYFKVISIRLGDRSERQIKGQRV